MYFDLYLPFPTPEGPIESSKKKKDKGKAKALPSEITPPKSCWEGITSNDKDDFAKTIALSGHSGYTVVGCTIPIEPSSHVPPSPFRTQLAFPDLDPRNSPSTSRRAGLKMVQVTRLHMRLDDGRVHCFTAANTNTLREYDLLSVTPMSDKALQTACTDLSNPGPNQISIITLPLHEKSHHFRLNRKQIRQAQRNGVVLEILYAAALYPPSSVPPETAKRYRQNWMSNAREVVRITNGKGVIFSSGPGGSIDSLRGGPDIVNLATILGMPANLAKDAVSLGPKMVLLKAQARRTYKAIFSTPKMTLAPEITASKRSADLIEPEEPDSKKVKAGKTL